MGHILIICDLFPPAFSPRMGYLCKYLKQYGWEATVLTEAVRDNTFTFLANVCSSVIYVNFYPAQNAIIRKIQWIGTWLLDFCLGYKNNKMYKEARKLCEKNHFDGILCSSFRSFPLSAAMRVAKKQHLPFIVDLRDILEQYPGYEFISHPLPSIPILTDLFISLFKRTYLRDRNQALREADYITTVSPWHVETLKPYNHRIELIYNGFDPDFFYPDPQRTDQFVITYTGRLLSISMRDPSLLLEALHILATEHQLDESTCRVHWYVDEDSWRIITEEAQKWQVCSFMDFKGYVPAPEIPSILNRSSMLLSLTNKATGTGPKGIMTTKFFESLAVEKPILCVRSDESYLEATIRETHSGVAARTVEEAAEFILQQYRSWKEKGYTHMDINQEAVARFSRKEQAKRFMRLFRQLTQDHHG